MRIIRLIPLVPVVCLPGLFAAPDATKTDYNPPIAKASDEAVKAIPRFQFDRKSLKCEVWAAEPMLANPVCFAFDEKGVCFVGETFRLHHGVTDTRGHMNWLDDDMACRTIADRIAKYKKFAGSEIPRDVRDRTRPHPPAGRHDGQRPSRQGDRIPRRFRSSARRPRRRHLGPQRAMSITPAFPILYCSRTRRARATPT